MKRPLVTPAESQITWGAEAHVLAAPYVVEPKELQHLKKIVLNCSQPARAVMQRIQPLEVDDVEVAKKITEEDLFGPASDSEDSRG